MPRFTVASPAYLARHGRPTHPMHLAQHQCLGYAYLSTPDVWRYTNAAGEQASVRPAGPLRVNNGEALMPALLAGLGIADLPDFIVGDAIASGEVEVILKGWKQRRGAVHLVTPPGGPAPGAGRGAGGFPHRAARRLGRQHYFCRRLRPARYADRELCQLRLHARRRPGIDVELALLETDAPARVVIEGDRKVRLGKVYLTRGAAATVGADDLAALAKGRHPGVGQVLVKLEPSAADIEACPSAPRPTSIFPRSACSTCCAPACGSKHLDGKRSARHSRATNTRTFLALRAPRRPRRAAAIRAGWTARRLADHQGRSHSLRADDVDEIFLCARRAPCHFPAN